MSNNKSTIIDGVSYDLSSADWELLQQIKGRSRVNVTVRESAGNQAVAPVPEKLNDVTVAGLVGHTNVVYYNFETNAWNRGAYNGCPINNQEMDTEHAHAFKAAMEKMPEFKAQYEMAASVTMTIDRKFYPGWKHTISNPRYSAEGTSVVGNIIVKNKSTGKYELYCKSWVGVNDYSDPADAVNDGADGFAYNGARNSDFRAALIAAHTR